MPLPGPAWGSYPERREAPQARWPWSRAPYRRQIAAVGQERGTWRTLDGAAFETRLRSLRAAIGRDGLTQQHTVQALAAATEAARRGLRLEPYDTQIHAALIMLDNRLAEMATGEGKTLAAALAAEQFHWGFRGVSFGNAGFLTTFRLRWACGAAAGSPFFAVAA